MVNPNSQNNIYGLIVRPVFEEYFEEYFENNSNYVDKSCSAN